MLRIGLVQMVCEKGAIEANLEEMRRTLEDARPRNLDFLVFPEMSFTGYADPTRAPEAVLSLDGPQVRRLVDLTRGSRTTVLAGLIEANPAGKPFITQVVARRGRLEGFYRKTTIKDEEETWFAPGERVPVFRRGGLVFGVAICADVENEQVFAECARQGAQVVFLPAAPGLYGEQAAPLPAARDWAAGFDWWQGHCQEHLSRFAARQRLWVAVATQAGRTVDEDFPGGAFVFAPDGERRFATPDGSPGRVYVEVDLEGGFIRELPPIASE